MSPRRYLLVALLLAAGAAALPAATPVIGAQLFQETKARIDDLFQNRDNPPKPPGPLDNPFRTTEAALPPEVAVNTDTGNGPGPVAGPRETPDEATLRQAYSNLSFGGFLIVHLHGEPVYLRVLSLTKDSITLGLGDARLTLHF